MSGTEEQKKLRTAGRERLGTGHKEKEHSYDV
jgi:hypothetical protein